MRHLASSVVAVAAVLVFSTAVTAAAGDLDTSFGGSGKVTTDFANSDDWGNDVALQADGKVVVAGRVYGAAGGGFALARYAVDGSLDPTFGGAGKVQTAFASIESASALAIQGDSKVVVAGSAYDPNTGTSTDFALARYNTNGTLDSSFGGDGKVVTDFAGEPDIAASVALQSDGKIVVAGYTGWYPSDDFAVARYNTDGSLDASFGGGRVVTSLSTGSEDLAYGVLVQPDGKIIVGGGIFATNSYTAALVRYLPNGQLDDSFDGDGKVVVANSAYTIYALALQADGKIVAAGGPSSFIVSRFNANGTVDAGFGVDGSAYGPGRSADDLVVQPDKKIVAAGFSLQPPGNFDFAVARFRSNGDSDETFGLGGGITTDVAAYDIAQGIAIGADGKIVVAGSSGSSYEGPLDFLVARYVGVTPTCRVPNVRGKRITAAKRAIRRARCAVGKVTQKRSKRVKKGRVISQRPRAGVTVPGGAKVKLVVSKGRRH